MHVQNYGMRANAYGMHEWDLFKNPNPKTRSRKQSMNKNPNSNKQTCSEHKKNYKNNLSKHINTKQDKENKIKTKKKGRKKKGSKNEYLKVKSS